MDTYYHELKQIEGSGFVNLPVIPDYSTNNAHIFYIVCKSLEDRSQLIAHLKENGILALFHYLSLHKSPYYENKHDGRELPQVD